MLLKGLLVSDVKPGPSRSALCLGILRVRFQSQKIGQTSFGSYSVSPARFLTKGQSSCSKQ
jgi:hypothetical protein